MVLRKMRGLATPVRVTRVEHIAAKALAFMFLPSSSSTAGKEARIQTGALPAVGWSVLLCLLVLVVAECHKGSHVRIDVCSDLLEPRNLFFGSERAGDEFDGPLCARIILC